MNFKQFLAILRARWALALAVILLITGGTAAISLMMQKGYSATASVLLDMKPDPLGGLAVANGLTPALIETQIDIIQSDRVAARVVKSLNLTDNAQIRAQWLESTKGEGNFEQWLGEGFQKNLDVRPSRASSVLAITYRAPDPKFAAALANAFARAYLDTALELRVDPAKQYSTFFDSRAKEARDNLERAQAKATAYQRENSIIANDERFDIETSRLNELSSQTVMMQAQSADSSIRQAQAQGAGGEKMQEVINNAVISGLKADLNRSEARLQELNSKFGESHPQIVEAKASIAELRSKIDIETRRIVGGVGVSSTISKQREAEVRGALEAQRLKLLKLKAIRDEGNVLLREADNAQKVYEQVVARLNQASLESQTNQSNVSMLSEARPPIAPSSPRVFLNIALASILGILLGIGVTLIVETLDRRVRLPEDIVEALALPILGSMPKPSTKRMFGTAKATLMQQRLLGPLASPGREA